MRFKCFIGVAALFVSTAHASNWQVTYIQPLQVMIDKESIIDAGKDIKQFWTLYAPIIKVGESGEQFAYRKTVHVINCPMRTAAVLRSIYYDENNVQHEAEVADKTLQYIVPDSADDYLWKYVCKPDEQKDLGMPVNGVQKFLADKVQDLKKNNAFLRQQSR